jgi:hypothetical protein
MWKAAIVGFVIVFAGEASAFAQFQPPLIQHEQIPAPRVQSAPVVKWEYYSATLDSNGNTFFNNLGNEGWELVAVSPSTYYSTDQVAVTGQVAVAGRAYFKRPKQN